MKMQYLSRKPLGSPLLFMELEPFFALQEAIGAFNSNYTHDFTAPMTPEKVLLGLYQKSS